MPEWLRLDGRRVASVVIVAALHVVLIAMLLQLSNEYFARSVPVHEVVLHFFSPKGATPQKPKRIEPASRKDKVPNALSPVPMPDYRNDIPALQSFGHALLDCAPENLNSLNDEDRARCAHSSLAQKSDNASVDYTDRTARSVSAALWMRRRGRKNAPLLLPCADPRNPVPSLATVFCLVKGAVDGKFDLDAPGYADKPEDLHLPNGGDPPDKPSR